MPVKQNSSHQHFKLSSRKVATIAVLLVLLYAVIPQIGSFRSSLEILGTIKPYYLAGAVLFSLATYFAAAGVYIVLATKTLSYLKVVLVQMAGMFVNRLVPAGIGAISINYEFLRKAGHSKQQAGAGIAVNNLSGIVGHLSLIIAVLVLRPRLLSNLTIPAIPLRTYWITGGVVLIILLVLAVLQGTRRRIVRTIIGIVNKIAQYSKSPKRLLRAWILSMSLTTLYVLCLWFTLGSLAVHISPIQALIVLSFGVAGASVLPTPGGLVGAEAGLVAGLMLFGIKSSDALAAALLYRLITYWLPLVLGPIALGFAERRRYI